MDNADRSVLTLTKREYAAISTKTPNSGDDDLNNIILNSRAWDLAEIAGQIFMNDNMDVVASRFETFVERNLLEDPDGFSSIATKIIDSIHEKLR